MKLYVILEGTREAGNSPDVDWHGRRLTFDETGSCIRVQTRRGEDVEGAEHLLHAEYVGVQYGEGPFLKVWDIRSHLEQDGPYCPFSSEFEPAPLRLLIRIGSTPLFFPGAILNAYLDEEVDRRTLNELPSSPAGAVDGHSRQSGERCAVTGGEGTEDEPSCKAG